MNEDIRSELTQINAQLEANDPNNISGEAILRYFSLLRECLQQSFEQINLDRNSDQEKLIKQVFIDQYYLGKIVSMTNNVIPDDLFEIFKDFDNDDPQYYPYLLARIRNKEYLIQHADK